MTIIGTLRAGWRSTRHFIDEDLIHPIEHMGEVTFKEVKTIGTRAYKDVKEIGYDAEQGILGLAKGVEHIGLAVDKGTKELEKETPRLVNAVAKSGEGVAFGIRDTGKLIPYIVGGVALLYVLKR